MEATSDAKTFALDEMKNKNKNTSIKLQRTKAIIHDDFKQSPEQEVRKMIQMDDVELFETPKAHTPKQLGSNTKPRSQKKKQK